MLFYCFFYPTRFLKAFVELFRGQDNSNPLELKKWFYDKSNLDLIF